MYIQWHKSPGAVALVQSQKSRRGLSSWSAKNKLIKAVGSVAYSGRHEAHPTALLFQPRSYPLEQLLTSTFKLAVILYDL